MNAIGIIAEYNPFHNGHALQIAAVKKKFPNHAVIIAMSGHSMQRGEFAVTDKWQRAKFAVQKGADLVFELPYCFCAQTAEKFAAGGVRLLQSAGCDRLSFGVETKDFEKLEKLAAILADEPQIYRDALHKGLKAGLSFAKAREKALAILTGDQSAVLLKTPNNILAVEYLKAIRQSSVSMQTFPVLRQSVPYHDRQLSPHFASAAAIRQALIQAVDLDHAQVLPYSQNILAPEKVMQSLSRYEGLILANLCAATPESLRNLSDVSEGLEFALLNAVQYHYQFDEIISAVSSKRIPKSRVRRILMHGCMGFTKKDFEDLSTDTPHYLRVLAFNQTGKTLIRKITKEGSCPIITNLRSNQTRLNAAGRRSLAFDCRSTDLFYLLRGEKEKIHADFRQHPVFTEETPCKKNVLPVMQI